MSRNRQALLALGVGVVVLAFVAWLDHSVMREVEQQAEGNFDLRGEASALLFGTLLVVAGALSVSAVGWRTGSLAASSAYIVLGGLFAALPWIVVNLASTINHAPPVLPDPLATRVNDLYTSTFGPLNGVETVGAAMFLVGVATVIRVARNHVLPVRPAESAHPLTSS